MMVTARIFIFIFLVLAQNQSLAQENADLLGDNVGSELGFHLGSLLPNQIPNVDEILSMWGARYGLKTGRGFFEMGAYFASGYDAKLTQLSVSIRGDIPVESLVGEVFLGVDLNQVVSPGSTETVYLGGGHVGGGVMALIAGDVWFRSDMKFNINPGTSLYIGFGFLVRLPEGSGSR